MNYHKYRMGNPWREMERFQREMNRIFDESTNGDPVVNVYTNSDGAIVTAEIPGVSVDDIEISVVGETLTLQGSRKTDDLNLENVTYHRQERSYGKFYRSLEMPFPIDAEKVEAGLELGILTIQLPRSEADKPRRISVKNG